MARTKQMACKPKGRGQGRGRRGRSSSPAGTPQQEGVMVGVAPYPQLFQEKGILEGSMVV